MMPSTAPDAPMIGARGAKIIERIAPDTPLIMYSTMNLVDPTRSSTRGPKKYNASMLNRMWVIDACRNMYVTTVHGWANTYAGMKTSALVSPGDVCWRKNTRMLATISRLTHGVTKYTPAVDAWPLNYSMCPRARSVAVGPSMREVP